jgi:hypothetical protein
MEKIVLVATRLATGKKFQLQPDLKLKILNCEEKSQLQADLQLVKINSIATKKNGHMEKIPS